MLSLSKKTDYGLELMIWLAKNYNLGPISLKDISRRKRLPYRFLEQVAMELKDSGLIGAKEGRSGGYFLLRKPKDISVADLIKILEGNLLLSDCLECERQMSCGPKAVWRDLEKTFYQQMIQKKLSDFM